MATFSSIDLNVGEFLHRGTGTKMLARQQSHHKLDAGISLTAADHPGKVITEQNMSDLKLSDDTCDLELSENTCDLKLTENMCDLKLSENI